MYITEKHHTKQYSHTQAHREIRSRMRGEQFRNLVCTSRACLKGVKKPLKWLVCDRKVNAQKNYLKLKIIFIIYIYNSKNHLLTSLSK